MTPEETHQLLQLFGGMEARVASMEEHMGRMVTLMERIARVEERQQENAHATARIHDRLTDIEDTMRESLAVVSTRVTTLETHRQYDKEPRIWLLKGAGLVMATIIVALLAYIGLHD